PDGTQLADSTEFEVLPALMQKTKKAKGQVPPFEIIPINPEEHPDKWAAVWPDLQDEEDEQKLGSVAYRVVATPESTIVYYSTIFAPFKEQVDRLKTGAGAMLDYFITNYEIWIAYHAILQDSAPVENKDESFEGVREQERALVAQMQVKQAIKTAELMKKLQTEEAGGTAAA